MEDEKKSYFGGVGGDWGDFSGGFMMVAPTNVDPLGLLLRHHLDASVTDLHSPSPPPPPIPHHLMLTHTGFRRHHRPAAVSPSPPKLDALILSPIQSSKPVLLLQEFLRSREVKEFISGALAGAMTKAVLAPLETIRTRMVVGVGSKNICGSFVEVFQKQGLQGLWAGNTINMVRIIPTQAIELGTFEFVKRAMTSAQEKWLQEDSPNFQLGNLSFNLTLSWLSPVAVAGAAAGVASTLACHPLEVLKDRLTISPEVYPSLSIAVRKMYMDGGVGALYAGIFPTLVGMLPYSTCYYFMYDTMKKSYCLAKNKGSLNRTEMLLIGALSGLTASTISYPLEVARKRLMVGALQGKCPPHMVAALSEVMRDEGITGLYRGWGASCLKVMPSSGITWMFYEAWKDLLLGSSSSPKKRS